MSTIAIRRGAVIAAVTALLVTTTPAAHAQAPLVPTVTGDPTSAEWQVIASEWRGFASFFSEWDCMGPIEVRVVERVEDHYPGRNVGPIASFYSFPPQATVYVEHGKVNRENLVHEFAHHLDISCSLGDLPFSEVFLAVQGFEDAHPWLHGSSWSAVPAEHFAQAVLVVFGVASTKIPITPEAVALVGSLGVSYRPEIQASTPFENRSAAERMIGRIRALGPL